MTNSVLISVILFMFNFFLSNIFEEIEEIAAQKKQINLQLLLSHLETVKSNAKDKSCVTVRLYASDMNLMASTSSESK